MAGYVVVWSANAQSVGTHAALKAPIWRQACLSNVRRVAVPQGCSRAVGQILQNFSIWFNRDCWNNGDTDAKDDSDA